MLFNKKIIILLTIILSINIYAIDLNNYINKKNCNQIIDKEIYKICYDYKMKGAKFVSYKLYGDLVNKNNIKKRFSFYTEKNLKKQYRSHTKDYTGTGYDRGHLANDGSFDYDNKILRKTYSMANIIPQAPNVNRKSWIKAEKYERQIAVKLENVNVLNGVIYTKNPKRIGRNKIAVPDAFFKVIYNNKKNYKKCFYYKNTNNIDVEKDKLKNHLVKCSKLNIY